MMSMIGPQKVKDTLNSLIKHNIPSREYLAQFVNENIFAKQED